MNISVSGRRQTGLTKTLTDAVRRKTLKMQGKRNEEADDQDDDLDERTMALSKGGRFMKDSATPGGRNGKPVEYDPEVAKMDFNYGTMRDFFDYSGVRVQDAIQRADLNKPKTFGYKLLPPAELSEEYSKLVKQVG